MARGSVWLTLEAADDAPAAYEPGHVLGLALKNADGSLTRHAYTVSSGDPFRRRFSHLYRVILGGGLTPRLEKLRAGDEMYFHGPFHNPIQCEIDPQARRIVGVATGTGIGPLYGFAAKTLAEGDRRPIALYASFRKLEDRVLLPELKKLAQQYTRFSFAFSLTEPGPDWQGLAGRVQENVPELLTAPDETHIHLVGRGDMVHLWREAWVRAGFARTRVSIETYFHHHMEPPRSGDRRPRTGLAPAKMKRGWRSCRLKDKGLAGAGPGRGALRTRSLPRAGARTLSPQAPCGSPRRCEPSAWLRWDPRKCPRHRSPGRHQ